MKITNYTVFEFVCRCVPWQPSTAKISSCSQFGWCDLQPWTYRTLELTVWLDVFLFFPFFFAGGGTSSLRELQLKNCSAPTHKKVWSMFIFYIYVNRHVNGLWLLNLTNCACVLSVQVLWLLESCFVVQEICFSIQAEDFVDRHSSYSQIENRFVQHTCNKTCKCSLNCKRRLPFWFCSSF
jgi:hypothetical protein